MMLRGWDEKLALKAKREGYVVLKDRVVVEVAEEVAEEVAGGVVEVVEVVEEVAAPSMLDIKPPLNLEDVRGALASDDVHLVSLYRIHKFLTSGHAYTNEVKKRGDVSNYVSYLARKNMKVLKNSKLNMILAISDYLVETKGFERTTTLKSYSFILYLCDALLHFEGEGVLARVIKHIARHTGLSRSAVRGIAKRINKGMSYRTARLMTDYYNKFYKDLI